MNLTQIIANCFSQEDYEGLTYYYEEASDKIRKEYAYEFGYSFFQTRNMQAGSFENCREIGNAYQISNFDVKLKEEILKLGVKEEYFPCATRLINESQESSIKKDKRAKLIKIGFGCLLLDHHTTLEPYTIICTQGVFLIFKENVVSVLNELIQDEECAKARLFLKSLWHIPDLFIILINNLVPSLLASKEAEDWIKTGIFLFLLKNDGFYHFKEEEKEVISKNISTCVQKTSNYITKLSKIDKDDYDNLKIYTKQLYIAINKTRIDEEGNRVKRYVIGDENIIEFLLALWSVSK